jgi:hypothetical protein
LRTVNAELETKIDDLSHANDDMKNLLNSTGIATIFLDNDLNIKRFTVAAKNIIHLIQTDIGRPIADIVTELEYGDLVRDAQEVLQTLVYKEKEVRTRDWSWYLMRLMPYRTAENVIEGIVITFVDITRIKKSEILLAVTGRMLESTSLRNAPLREVLDDILVAIENQTHGISCAVSLLDREKGKLFLAAAPSLPRAFSEQLSNIIGRDSSEPCAAAVSENRQIELADIAGAASTTFSELALKHNIKAAWAQPVCSADGTLLGAFAVYYREAHQPFPMEKALIDRLVPLMGTAISRHIAGGKP